MAAGPVPEDLELHRPYVDDVVLTCPECGGEMRRVPEVIDAWFDSGSMPFGQWHYPFENVETFEERFPADFICEAIDQTRGWFYSLIAVATLIEGRSSYKRVLCLGHILDGEGQKMSKSKGNVVQPDDILDHQGADAFRWFMFASQQPWSPRRFSAEMVDEVVRKFLLTLWNTYSFFTLYANIDRFDPTAQESPRRGAAAARPLARRRAEHARPGRHRRPRGLRRHRHQPRHPAVRRRPQQLVRAPQPASLLEERERRRQAGRLPHAARGARDGDQAARAVHAVRRRGALPEPGALGRRRRAPESVHLCAWPVADEQAIDAGVSFDMAAARRVVEMGRAARNAAAVKTRQPLAEVVVALPEAEARAVERLRDVVLDELNVKDLRVVGGEDELVAYVVKPNLKVLGPKLGKRLGPLQAALKEADAAALVAAVRAEGAAVVQLPDGELSLAEEELLIETGSPEGYQVESDGGRVVALKTDVDEALREEGLARELIHAVQLARKAADLRIEDTISLTLDVPEELRPPAERHRGAIMAETLASEFALGEAAGDHRETARVDGHEVGIGLSVTGTIFTVTYG